MMNVEAIAAAGQPKELALPSEVKAHNPDFLKIDQQM